MDVHEPPRVTIEGGPGWQVDASPDVIGAEPRPVPRWRPSRALVWTGAVSALVGFAAATAVAELRHDRAGEVDASTLSVSVWSPGDNGVGLPAATKDGRTSLRVPFELANNGPREIQLLSLRLTGTDLVSEDLGGRRLNPGDRARVFLLRPLDCGSDPGQVAPEGDVSRLTVRARTDAGVQEVEVRAALNTWLLSRDIAVAMCGDLPPDEALSAEVTDTAMAGATALLTLQVGNRSRHRFTVERVRVVVPWLSARFVDAQGRAVPLPLSLAAGDFSTPRGPWDVAPTQTWRVELAVPDCRRVPSPVTVDFEEPLLTADVDSGERAGAARFGGDPNLVRELVLRACS